MYQDSNIPNSRFRQRGFDWWLGQRATWLAITSSTLSSYLRLGRPISQLPQYRQATCDDWLHIAVSSTKSLRLQPAYILSHKGNTSQNHAACFGRVFTDPICWWSFMIWYKIVKTSVAACKEVLSDPRLFEWSFTKW